MQYFVYRSTALVPDDGEASREILVSSLRNNADHAITGFLHREDHMFLQYVEGPGAAIDTLWAALGRDTRHRDIVLLGRGLVDGRQFSGWSMGLTSRDMISFREFLAEEAGKSDFTEAAEADAITFLRDACLVLDRRVLP